MKRIMIPTGPEDIVNEIEKWPKRHSDSKVAAGVRSGLVRLQRFSASIDMPHRQYELDAPPQQTSRARSSFRSVSFFVSIDIF